MYDHNISKAVQHTFPKDSYVDAKWQHFTHLEEARQTLYEAQALLESAKQTPLENGYYANHWANLFDNPPYAAIVEDLVDRLHFLKGVNQKYGNLAPRLYYECVLQYAQQTFGKELKSEVAFKAKWDSAKKETLEHLELESLNPDWPDNYAWY